MLTWLGGMSPCHTERLRRIGQASCTVLLAMLIVVVVPTATNSDFDSHQHYSPQEIRRAIVFYARRYRLDPALLRAVMKAESGYRQHVVSRKGAIGLMQLTPDTAATLRVANVYDSMENIRGGNVGARVVTTGQNCSKYDRLRHF